jgi:hypothetical protein
MADPKIYEHTYWSHKGKHPLTQDALESLVPAEGEIPNAESNPALEQFRIAANCYYDLYNNGLCNLWEEFEEVFGFHGPYYEYEADEDDDDQRPYRDIEKAWWTVQNVNRVEDRVNEIIIQAAIEQGITVEGYEAKDAPNGAQAIQAEVDRLSVELASNHVKMTKVLKKESKPFVQLTGEDGNVFSVIGRVSKALKQNGQGDKAKEFSTKAMHADSYESVLRLAMEYCEVG